MFPRLFTLPAFDLLGREIGPLTLHTYGVLLALAFLAGLWAAGWQARKAGHERRRPSPTWRSTSSSPASWARSCSSSWSSGGTTRATRGSCSRWCRAAASSTAGSSAPSRWPGGTRGAMRCRGGRPPTCSLPRWCIGQSVGRIGCFAAGCCYGRPAEVPWAITFHDEYANRVVGTPLNTPLHPTQLYESLACLLIFGILIAIAARKKFHGQVALAYVVLYAVARFVIEFFRGDVARGSILDGALSTSQFIAILMVLGAALIGPYAYKKHRADRRSGARLAAMAGTRTVDVEAGRRRRAARRVAGADAARPEPRAHPGLDRGRRGHRRRRVPARVVAGARRAAGRGRGARSSQPAVPQARGHRARRGARGRAPAGGEQAGRPRRPSRGGHAFGHAGERAPPPRPRPVGRRRRAAARHRAPAGPRDVRPHGGRQERRGPPRAGRAVRVARGGEAVPGRGARRAPAAERDHRRAHRPPSRPAQEDVHAPRRAGARRARPTWSRRRWTARRCCACASTPGARTRSASTSRPSAIPSSATRRTAARARRRVGGGRGTGGHRRVSAAGAARGRARFRPSGDRRAAVPRGPLPEDMARLLAALRT